MLATQHEDPTSDPWHRVKAKHGSSPLNWALRIWTQADRSLLLTGQPACIAESAGFRSHERTTEEDSRHLFLTLICGYASTRTQMSVQNQNVAITVATCLFALGNPYKPLKLLFGPLVLIVSYCIVCNLTSATENLYNCPRFQGGNQCRRG